MERLKNNQEILQILNDTALKYPDMRFIQILWTLGIINKKDFLIEDRFYEESEETLQKIKQKYIY